MRMCYISDLHLEFRDEYFDINNEADILILSGDIGNPYEDIYMNFLIKVSNNFDKIILITGNHEYYSHNKSILETNEKIKNIITENKLENIIFLNNEVYIYKNIRFIGSTLWSYIHNKKTKNLTNCFFKIKDFKINKNKKEIIKKYNEIYENNKCFINDNLINDNLINIVITHHLPSYDLVDIQYKNDDMNQCFDSNCNEIINKQKIDYWFYGHTHTKSINKINKTQFLCNPVGYPDENDNIYLNEIIEIK